MERLPPSRPALVARRWLIVLALTLIVLAAFGRVAGHEFLSWDDEQHVLANPSVNPPSWQGLTNLWLRPYWGLYVPLSYSLFIVEAALSKGFFPQAEPLHPMVFHVGNLLLHLGCVLMAFVLLRELLAAACRAGAASGRVGRAPPVPPLVDIDDSGGTRGARPTLQVHSDLAAAFGVLLFALHPVQVESVAWISEARGLLCGLLSLTAIWLYVRYAADVQHQRRHVLYLLATIAFLLALLAKPAAVAVPLMVALIDLGWLRRPWRPVLLTVGPWVVLAIGFGLLTKSKQPNGLMPFITPLWARPLLAADAVGFYLKKLVLPVGLGPDYGRSPQSLLADTSHWLRWAWIISALVLALAALSQHRRVLLVSAGLFLAWLVPVLGLVAFDFQRVSTVADRYLYLAMIGPALATAWAIDRWWSLRSLATATAVLAVLAGLTFMQAGCWHDTAALMAQVRRINPTSAVAQYHQGLLLARQGEIAGAADAYRQALADHPEFVELYIELGNALLELNRPADALEVLREGARLHGRLAPIHNNLANVLAETGAMQDAAAHFRQSIGLDPHYAAPHAGLGKLLCTEGRRNEAIGEYRRALELQPEYLMAHLWLGVALEAQGDLEGARTHYLAARAINPHEATAHYNLGNLAARSPETIEEAIGHYRRALECKPDYAVAHVNLGAALLAQGNYREAIEQAKAAVKIDPALENARRLLEYAEAAEKKRTNVSP